MIHRNWLLGLALAGVSFACGAQGWTPQRNIEIVVGSAPGGSNDKTARQVERILVEQKLVPTSISVVNRSGAGGTLALNYLNQHQGDGHHVIVFTPSMLTNHITGQSKAYYKDFTPIASLFSDYIVFPVNSGGSIKDGKDLVARLKKDPQSVSVGFATALGSHNHIAIGLLMKAIGGDPKSLKVIAYKGSSLAITNLLGAHIDLVTTAAGNAAPHVQSGKLRVVAAAAPTRFPGVLSNVPTWKELGYDFVFGGWRAIVGPKNMTPEQIAYWEGILTKATQVGEWKDGVRKNYWFDNFVTSAEFKKDIEKDYNDMKSVLVDLGLAK
jgi:putative tricarboxylic transport membrane protein